MIGIGQPFSTRLLTSNRLKLPPYLPNSPASKAIPELNNGDQIVGTTDPDRPDELKALPPDPRGAQPGRYDFFELNRRLQRLAGREITVQVRPAGEPDTAPPISVKVPAAFNSNTGLIMQIGPIVAVRRGSPADLAGVRAKDAPNELGDTLEAVDLPNADGTTLRYVVAKSAQSKPKTEERVLDPVRLPFDLRRWADSQPAGPKSLRLTLIRQVEHRERK